MALPRLNLNTLLAHIFGPKRNPKPAGLRAVKLKGLRGGRKAGRLAAFNRMDPVNQEMLKRSGDREEYLKGNKTLAEIKKGIREQAVELGLAKPPRTPKPEIGPPSKESPLVFEQFTRDVAAQLMIDRLRTGGVPHNEAGIRKRAQRLTEIQVRRIIQAANAVDGVMRIKTLASKSYNDDPELYIKGEYNAFWYN